MSGEVCLIMTPKLEELYNKLQSKYPKECEASLVNKNVFLGWVELYQKDFNKTPDFTPDLKSLVPYVENLRKREGKSFLNKEIAQKSEANSTLVQFIKDIETLAGYYEGGGRVLSDDVPNFPNELDDKLNDYFMGGKELSLDDYRRLWKVLEFKDGKVYARKPTTTEDNKQDIVTQLIDQLKASGITVLGKADMKKYLTEKGKLDPIYNLMFIGKRARNQFEHQLRKARPDMSDAEIKSTLDFLHSLKDSKENTAYIKTAIRWIANKSLTLPQDHTKAYQVFEQARKKHIDLQKYNTIGELIASPEMQPKEKEKVKFNPDEAKTFSNKRTVTTKGGRVFTVYDVENTEEGQREVCKALAAHYKTSPWCLSTFTSKGEPTQSAKKYWNEYSGIPRKIAFENGKPVAFSSEEPESLGGWHTLDGIQVYVAGEFMPTGEIVTSIDKGTISEEKREEWIKKGYIYPNIIYARSYQLTDKGIEAFEKQKQEAWWDMEDTHPQDSLSDSIVSEPKHQEGDSVDGIQIADIYDAAEFDFGRLTENHLTTQEEVDPIPFFMTPEGEVYGFVDEKGNIYLDETVISPEHPIHEYTHLWDTILVKKNPALWNRGKQLLKDKNLKLKGHEKSIWQEIEEDPNYGLKWDKTKARYEDYVASEVHARLTGKKGLQLLDEIAKQKGSKNIISKLKQWILDVYKELKATFSKWTPEELDKLTIKDFTYMTLSDFLSDANINQVNSNNIKGFMNKFGNKGSISTLTEDRILKHQGNWSRLEAANNPKTLYVFTDNTDRDSGSGIIPADSWYSKKYGAGHHFPTMTAAVVRGLDNSRPISTQRWYHQGAKGTTGRWTDADLEEFKKVIREELQEIVNEFNTGKYDTIMFPDGDGLFNTRISAISKTRTPKLYQALADLLHEYGFDSLIPSDDYNEDGTLKDNIFTQTEHKNDSNSTTPTATNNTSLSNITIYNSNNLVNETPKTAVQRKEVKEIDKPNSEAVTSALEISKNEDREYHEAFSPRQISDLGEYFGKVFSRNLDAVEGERIDELNELLSDDSYTKKEKEEIRETLNKFEDPVKGRQLIAQEYGINNLINDVLKEVKGNIEDAKEYNNEDELVLWTNTEKYFTKIFNEQATLNIEEAEGIRIVDLEVKESTTDDPNNDEDDDDDTSQYADKEASGWLYKARYTDPASTLSKKVKRLFSYIEKEVLVIDKDGNGKYVTEKNSIGMPKYYSTSQVYATFLSYFSNNVKNPDSFMHICKTYDELVEAIGEDEVKEWVAEDEEEFKEDYPYGYPLFPALEEMEKQYPWVKGIIGKLTNDFWKGNTYHTYGTLSSQMYSGLKLAFLPYDKYDKTAGRLRYLNHDMAEQVMLEKLKTNYYNGITLTNTSIYNSDGSINVENLKEISKHKYSFEDDRYIEAPTTDSSEEEVREFYDAVAEYLNYIQSFGISMDTNTVAALLATKKIGRFLERLGYIQKVISKQIESGAKSADTFDYMVDVRHLKSDVNLWKDLFTGAGIITDDQYVQSFRDSATKKTKYSYSSDNYIMNTFRSIGMGSLEDRKAYIDEHYSKYEWFRNQKTGEWRNYWLELFYTKGIDNLKGSVDEFLLPAYRNVDNIEDEKKGKPVVRNYTKWTAEDIFDIQQSGYDQKNSWAFYLAPIFSDSPMSLMIRGPKFTMERLIEKHKIKKLKGNRLVDVERRGAFVELVRQELARIKYEVERQKAIKEGKILPIDNFDYGNALKFCFIPELNDHTINGMTLKEAIANAQKDLATDDEIDDIIRKYVKEVLEPNFIAYYSANMKDFDTISDFKKDQLRVRYYNMVYANASMIQLLTVDLAFYKNFIDFQKRWKEVYSGGNKPNTSSRFGKKTENVAVLRDIIITSPSYSHVAAAVDKNPNLSKEDKEHIKGIFKNVNVADAQAIRSLKSFRAVMDMLGKWSLAHDKALENFNNNNWNRADFDAIMNVLKPFLYGVIDTPDGLGNHIPMPVQHKNSEICALMMYSLIANSLNNSTVYKALSRFMDETVGSDGEPLIDMIEFESASKVCNQGVINISFSPEKVKNFIAHGFDTYGIKLDPIKDDNGKIIPVSDNTAETYYNYIKDSLDDMLDKGTINQDKYNKIMAELAPSEDEIISMLKSATTIVNKDGNTVINTQRVKTIPFDYYSESQHVPLHHEDAKVPHGSQARNLAVADVSDNTTIELKGKGEKQQFKGQDIVDFYYKLLNENLLEDYFGADGKGGLSEIFSSNESLAEAIKDVVRGNPKYDSGFMEALELHDGKFNLSLNSPTMFSAIQSIITAFFRNRITKQKVDGATLVQAAGVGLNKDLRLRFDDNGKLIGLECYLPVTSKALFEPLLTTDAEGNTILDPKKLEEFGLNEAVGYRIPTENKSSMAPLIIKGFTPIQNGSVIILPAEITALAGSDFDVDKLFLILSSFNVRNYNMAKAWEDFAKENNIKVNITNSIDISHTSDEEFFSYLKEIGFDESFNKWFNRKTGNKTAAGIAIINKDQYLLRDKKTGEPKPEVFAVKYDFNKSPKENGRKARNNMILQITNQILRSKEGSEAFLNPQGFKDVEDAANFMRVLNAFRSGNPEIINLIPGESYAEKLSNLTKLKSKELSALAKNIKNPVAPVYPQTFAKLHAQNMAGVEQLGIYAVQASMSAKHQRANIVIKPYLQFTINGRTIDRIDTSRGGRTVKNTNQMVGAAADNGKNPTLSAMGSTSNTASVIGTLLREGLTHKEAALIVNSPYMQLSKEKLMGIMNGKFPKNNEVTTDMLMRVYVDSDGTNNIASEDDIYNVMALCYKVKSQHTSIEFVNKVSRADSPNGGMKSSYAGCRVQRYKVDVLQAMMGQKTFAFEPIKETLSNDAINITGSEDEIRKQLYNQKMGLLHGMYALGINSFGTLTKNFFFGSQKWFDDKIIKPILYNLPVDTSDNTLIDIVNSVYKAYVVYRLSDSKLFGNDGQYTMEEKRKYYTEKFPEDFKKLMASNKEVRDLLGNIFTVKMGKIMLLDASNISKKQMAIVKTRVGDLRYSKDEEVRRLATDLLLYSYYENGLQFSNTSISSAFSTDFLMSFKEYSKVLEDMNKEVSEEDTRNFIHQFLSFNHEMAVLVPPSLKDDLMWDKSTGDMLIMNDGKNTIKKMTSPILSPNPKGDINMYKYVIWMGQIYIYDKEATEDQNYASLVYHRVPTYSNSKMHPVFNSNLKVSDLEELYSETAKEEMKKEKKDAHDSGLIQEAKNRQGLGKVEDKNMLYDYEGMEDEPFNYMDVATQDYNMEDQNVDDLVEEVEHLNPGFDPGLNEDYLENLLEEADTKTINVDVSDDMLDASQYSQEGNDTLDIEMCASL